MNTKKKLPDLKLKILCVLADNKYHTSQEIEELLDIENRKRIEEKNLRRQRTLLFDRNTGHVLGFKDAPRRKEQEFYKSIYKSNLWVELRELISLDWINRELSDKKCNPGERGHRREFVYYIKKDTYPIVDKILGHELDKEKHRLYGALKGLDDWPLNCSKSLKRIFRWNRSKNPLEFDKYIQAAIDNAEYKEGSYHPYGARIPMIPEVPAEGVDKESCREELKFNLEDWIALQLGLRIQMPPINGHTIDVFKESDGPFYVPQIGVSENDLEKSMEEAVQENIRLTNEWIRETGQQSEGRPKADGMK